MLACKCKVGSGTAVGLKLQKSYNVFAYKAWPRFSILFYPDLETPPRISSKFFHAVVLVRGTTSDPLSADRSCHLPTTNETEIHIRQSGRTVPDGAGSWRSSLSVWRRFAAGELEASEVDVELIITALQSAMSLTPAERPWPSECLVSTIPLPFFSCRFAFLAL